MNPQAPSVEAATGIAGPVAGVASGDLLAGSTFDRFCDEMNVTDEEREALVHHLAAMRHRETLKLIDGPIVRAAKAAAEKRRRANDTNRAGGPPSYHGSRLHQQLRKQVEAENASANNVLASTHLSFAKKP